LKNLYLADNAISSLEGVGNLPNLQRLHLRKNKLTELNKFPDLPNLEYLNLRENLIAKIDVLKGISLKVKVLNLLANPISEELGDNAKKEVWMKYRQYNRINKSDVTPEEREEFDKEFKERLA
jgi:Leucine-rich repeat (LRR) protein